MRGRRTAPSGRTAARMTPRPPAASASASAGARLVSARPSLPGARPRAERARSRTGIDGLHTCSSRRRDREIGAGRPTSGRSARDRRRGAATCSRRSGPARAPAHARSGHQRIRDSTPRRRRRVCAGVARPNNAPVVRQRARSRRAARRRGREASVPVGFIPASSAGWRARSSTTCRAEREGEAAYDDGSRLPRGVIGELEYQRLCGGVLACTSDPALSGRSDARGRGHAMRGVAGIPTRASRRDQRATALAGTRMRASICSPAAASPSRSSRPVGTRRW